VRNQKLLILISSSISKAREEEIPITNTQKTKTWQTTLKNSLRHNKEPYKKKKKSRTIGKNKINHNKEELPEIRSKTLRKTVRTTLIKVNQHLFRLEIGNNPEEHSEDQEEQIIKTQGEALTTITTLHLGEVVEDIITEARTVNKLKAQTLDLEVDTGAEVLIIIKMATSLEAPEVVETIEEVKESKKSKTIMTLIIVQMMQILKKMLIILLRKSSNL
jgi:hypothetical protein